MRTRNGNPVIILLVMLGLSLCTSKQNHSKVNESPPAVVVTQYDIQTLACETEEMIADNMRVFMAEYHKAKMEKRRRIEIKPLQDPEYWIDKRPEVIDTLIY